MFTRRIGRQRRVRVAAASLLGVGGMLAGYAGIGLNTAGGANTAGAAAVTPPDSCGYPNASHNPLSSTAFNEDTLAKDIQVFGSGASARVVTWANDEKGVLLGVTQTGQTGTVTANTTSPQH